MNAYQITDRQADAPTGFWWVPFGRNATLTQLADAEAIALGAPAVAPPPPYAPPYDPSTAIAEVIDVVREVAGGELPASLEEEFSHALWSLAMHQP